MALPSQPAVTTEERSSSEWSSSSLKGGRTARFAEATMIHSPSSPGDSGKSPFADPPSNSQTPPDVSDLGFGYVAASDPAKHASHHDIPANDQKGALKVPGTPGRTLNPLSPTFREEFFVEKQEKVTEKENQRDLRIKLRVRVAKVFLRFINLGCSMIVLTILGTTLTVFNATKSLPERNTSPPWEFGTNPWPQYLLLAVSCLSLIACLGVFWGYWRGGRRRAQKYAAYYSLLSVFLFIFQLVMWIVAAAIFEHSKATGDDKDLWGWACVHNEREQLFKDQIDYALLCRLQDWGLVCAVIEIVLEVFVLVIYGVIFYRFWSKRKLARSMDRRDRARTDLYIAQLRQNMDPNTPGFPTMPKAPFVSTSIPQDQYSAAENGQLCTTQFATPPTDFKKQSAFQLQPPPIRVQQASPQPVQSEFPPPPAPAPVPSAPNQHMGAAPGERTYESVPIPGAYAGPMSPSFPHGTHQ
ncbi:hypothetical protein AtubIFM55763_011554 [Aspergillus tubingensis]|uniref:MARVEL domain-containing protein n=2 Tax=Aspergillus subgen. Circumdati TaxID=2720871 RepID=A0A1L9NEB4_ASPTC|nr:hexokinase family protein [Aspergillus tubingensis]OJI87636.1 hypothetical protein ASPTUDRAFT_435768 [Aspergillus tubingensis CBS 134.48]GAQ46787.1 hypothetical protein ANI_1_40114 [Aspergillus niger]GFN19334.1 hexokinase family protein [Aspergillus tubingensis]GLA59017.1 hypothetical protein AtubIFM54640_009746 [Aspergillus tubingensis]GLA70340.1 hypothetical protein AtubIFM55763_011554 [Aspergillus tubingensis]